MREQITTRWPWFNKLSKQTVWSLWSNGIRVYLNTDCQGNSTQLSNKYKTIQNYKAIQSLQQILYVQFSDVHSTGRGWQSPLQERNQIVGGAHDRDRKGRPCSEKREESHQSQNHQRHKEKSQSKSAKGKSTEKDDWNSSEKDCEEHEEVKWCMCLCCTKASAVLNKKHVLSVARAAFIVFKAWRV